MASADATALELVLVTGASGYIASHVIHQLLTAKDEATGQPLYRVRGTVRDASNEKKSAPIRGLAAKLGAEDRFELVSTDLMKDDGWDSACEGCTYVQHVASPLPAKVSDPQEIIRPAIEGVERAMKAAANAKTVKRFILTSSLAAMSGGGVPSRCHLPADHVFTEEDWADPDISPPYEASKILAEKRAWALWKEMPEEGRFEFVSILPGFVFGPLVINNPGTSLSLITAPMTNAAPALPVLTPPIVDVRDVATIHVRAMTTPGVSGNRYMGVSLETGVLDFPAIGRMLNERYGPQGYKVTTRAMPNFLVRIAKYFNSDLKLVAPYVGQTSHYDISKTRNAFKLEYIHPRQAVLDAAESCIEFGVIPEPVGGRKKPPADDSSVAAATSGASANDASEPQPALATGDGAAAGSEGESSASGGAGDAGAAATTEPAASEPAASEPAASEPAASEPAASDTAASEPAASDE